MALVPMEFDDESVVTATASSLVTYNNVSILTLGKIVIVSGRFTMTEKASGQSNWIFSVPIAKGGAVVAVSDTEDRHFLINDGKLTANAAIPAGNYNIMAAYVSQ